MTSLKNKLYLKKKENLNKIFQLYTIIESNKDKFTSQEYLHWMNQLQKIYLKVT